MKVKISTILLWGACLSIAVSLIYLGWIFFIYQRESAENKIIDRQIMNEDGTFNRDVADRMRCVCYIQIPGTRISYPVVQGDNNSYYLNHNASNMEANSGAIFLDALNSPSMKDIKSIIYGHNMKDGSMFHDLRYYRDEDFANEHKDLIITLPDDTKRTYQFAGVVNADTNDESIYEIGGSFSAINTLEAADVDVSDYTGQRIVVLSTCTGAAADEREIVIFIEQ